MRPSTMRKSGLVAAAASALVAIGIPMALAAPTATLPSDAEGYVDSTARCTKPDTAVLFGTTRISRVAICKTADGTFEYRGVRVRDGAKLVAPATRTSENTFVVDSDGVKYTVTATALSVTANGNTFRTEIWTDYHGPRSAAAAPSGSPSTASKPSTAAAQPNSAKPSSAGTVEQAKPQSAQPSPAAPLPPPLAAEVGGGE